MRNMYEGKLTYKHPEGAVLFVTEIVRGNFKTSMYPTKALPDTVENRAAVARIAKKLEKEAGYLSENPVKRKKNPIMTRADKVSDAQKLRDAFLRTVGVKGRSTKAREIQHHTDDVMLEVGMLDTVEYTVRGADGKLKHYRHEFTGRSRPTLAVSHDGRQAYFVGGHYRFKHNGINDTRK